MEPLDKLTPRSPRSPVCGSLSVTVILHGQETVASVIDVSESGLGLLFHEGEKLKAGDFIKVSGKDAMVRWSLPLRGGIAAGVMLYE